MRASPTRIKHQTQMVKKEASTGTQMMKKESPTIPALAGSPPSSQPASPVNLKSFLKKHMTGAWSLNKIMNGEELFQDQEVFAGTWASAARTSVRCSSVEFAAFSRGVQSRKLSLESIMSEKIIHTERSSGIRK